MLDQVIQKLNDISNKANIFYPFFSPRKNKKNDPEKNHIFSLDEEKANRLLSNSRYTESVSKEAMQRILNLTPSQNIKAPS